MSACRGSGIFYKSKVEQPIRVQAIVYLSVVIVDLNFTRPNLFYFCGAFGQSYYLELFGAKEGIKYIGNYTFFSERRKVIFFLYIS